MCGVVAELLRIIMNASDFDVTAESLNTIIEPFGRDLCNNSAPQPKITKYINLRAPKYTSSGESYDGWTCLHQ